MPADIFDELDTSEEVAPSGDIFDRLSAEPTKDIFDQLTEEPPPVIAPPGTFPAPEASIVEPSRQAFIPKTGERSTTWGGPPVPVASFGEMAESLQGATPDLTAVGEGMGYVANVARAIPADVAMTVSRQQKYYDMLNLGAAALGETMPIDELLKEAATEPWSTDEEGDKLAKLERSLEGITLLTPTTVGKISQGIAGTAPMVVAFGGLPAAAQKVALVGFTFQMLKEAPEVFSELGDELGKPKDQQDPDKISTLVSQGIQDVGFGTAGALSLARGPMAIRAMEIGKPEQIRAAQIQAPGRGLALAPEAAQQLPEGAMAPSVWSPPVSVVPGAAAGAATFQIPPPVEQPAEVRPVAPTARVTTTPGAFDIAQTLGIEYRGETRAPGRNTDKYVDEDGITVSVPAGSPLEVVTAALERRRAEYQPSAAAPVVEPTTAIDPTVVPTVELPIDRIAVNRDIPQFKGDADPETGIVAAERLQGRYVRMGTAPIVVWEKANGDLEVITGRHRLDLAKRTGEKTIPAQVVREADGFTRDMALTFDAEANIRDEKGTLKDYAHYFKNTRGLTEAEARQRGLLSTAKGQAGWDLAQSASNDLYALWSDPGEKISDAKALAIARAAPGDAARQQLGMRLAEEGKSADYIRARIERDRAQTDVAQQTDMFGNPIFDETKADTEARMVAGIRRDLAARIKAAQNAARNPEAARQAGIDVRDPAATLRQIEEWKSELDRWNGTWWLDRELVARVTHTQPAPATLLAQTGAGFTFAGKPLGADVIWKTLQKRYGFKEGEAAVKVLDVFEPGKEDIPARLRWMPKTDPATGRNVLDQYGKPIPDRPVQIEINRSRIHSEGQLRQYVLEELGHWYDVDNKGMAEGIIKGLTPEETNQLATEIVNIKKYPQSEQWAEMKAQGIQRLVNSWNGRPWFERIVLHVQDFLVDKLNLKVSDKLLRARAEKIAVQAIWNATERVRGTEKVSLETAPSFEAKAPDEGLVPDKESQLLTEAVQRGSDIYLSFDLTGKVPTARELTQKFRELGHNVEAISFEPNVISTSQGIAKFRIMVADEGGRLSTESAKKAFKDAFGQDTDIRVKSRTQEAIPFEDRFGKTVQAYADREVGLRKKPAPADPKAVAREIGFTFNPEKQIAGVKWSSLSEAEQTRWQEAGYRPTWEFTDRRDNSPTRGVTFYVNEGASRPEILARLNEHLKSRGLPTATYETRGQKYTEEQYLRVRWRARETKRQHTLGDKYEPTSFEEYTRQLFGAGEPPGLAEGIPTVAGRPFAEIYEPTNPRAGAAEIIEARKNPDWITWEAELPYSDFLHLGVERALEEYGLGHINSNPVLLEQIKDGAIFEGMGHWAKRFVTEGKPPNLSGAAVKNAVGNFIKSERGQEALASESLETPRGSEETEGYEPQMIREGQKQLGRIAPKAPRPDYMAIAHEDAMVLNDIRNSYAGNEAKLLDILLSTDHGSEGQRLAFDSLRSELHMNRTGFARFYESVIEKLKSDSRVQDLFNEMKQVRALANMGAYEARPLPPPEELGRAADDLTRRLRATPVRGARETVSSREQIADTLTQGRTIVERIAARTRATTETIKDMARGAREPNELDVNVGQLDWLLQRGAGQSRDLGRAIENQVRNANVRRAVALWLDTPGTAAVKTQTIRDALSDLQLNPALWRRTPGPVRRAMETAANMPPEGLELANALRDYLARRETDALENNLFEHGLEDYFTHVWGDEKNMPDDLRGAIGGGRVQSYWQFARQRRLGTLLDGIARGKVPQLDPSKVLPFYNYTLDRAAASRRFIKDLADNVLASDGRPALAPTGTIARVPAGVTPHEATLVHPKGKFDEFGDYRVVNHPALRKWKWLTNDESGAPVLSQNDLVVHPEYFERLARIMDQTRLRGSKVSQALLRASTEVKGLKLGLLSAFHQVHVGSHALFHWTLPFRFADARYFTPEGKINWNSPDVRYAVEKGHLKIAPDPRELKIFAEGLLSPGLVHKIPIVGAWSRAYSEYTFGDFIPKLKLKTFANALPRNQRWYRGKLSDEAIAARVGDSVNNAFGELNQLFLGKLGRNPTTTRILRGVFLAPDFGEARLRFVGKALTSYGTEERLALATMFVTLYSAARVGNWLSHGDPEWDVKRAFQVKVGDHWWSMRSVLGDLDRAITDSGRFFYVRLNPLYSRTAADWLFGRDINGRKLSATEKFITRPANQLVPIQFQALTRDDQKLWESFIGSMGLSAISDTPQQDVYRLVDDWLKSSEDPKRRLQYERRQAEVFPPSDYVKIRFALRHEDFSGAEKAYNELLKTRDPRTIDNALKPWTGGNINAQTLTVSPQHNKPFTGSLKTEAEFLRSLTPAQRKLYDAALEDRKKLYRNFQAMKLQQIPKKD